MKTKGVSQFVMRVNLDQHSNVRTCNHAHTGICSVHYKYCFVVYIIQFCRVHYTICSVHLKLCSV